MAGLVGNIMEWYDFAVYGYFASIIGAQFFPSENPAVSLISAFGAFAAGFLMRPIGGILFGRIGDVFGRKRVLTLSVLSMAIPTVLIGLMPNYAAIGIALSAVNIQARSCSWLKRRRKTDVPFSPCGVCGAQFSALCLALE